MYEGLTDVQLVDCENYEQTGAKFRVSKFRLASFSEKYSVQIIYCDAEINLSTELSDHLTMYTQIYLQYSLR